MRRVHPSAIAVTAVAGLTLILGGGVALAAPAPAPSGAAGQPGKRVCTVEDERLVELSGLVATKSGYIVINDSTDLDSRERVFYLNKQCEVGEKRIPYSGAGPRDTEDLALSPDGKTLWIADTGDNVTSTERRETVGLWSMPIGGGKEPVLHRFAYPDGQPRDAEALLISADNVPVIITKAIGPAELYVPAGEIKTDNETPVELKKVGEVTLPATTTPNPLQAAGRLTVTGAARSPDGTKIALRTYADAFEWDLAGGDVVATLTGSVQPRVTPLANPFGEAISYSNDGKLFLTVSDGGQLGEDEPIEILSYTPSTPAPEAPVAASAGGDAGGSLLDRFSLQDITKLIAVIGLIGLLLVGAGMFGILRSRKRKAGSSGSGASASGPSGSGPSGRAAGPLGAPEISQDLPPRIGRQPQAYDGWGSPDEYAGPGGSPGPAWAGRVYGAGGGSVYGGGAEGEGSGNVYGGGGAGGAGRGGGGYEGRTYGSRPSGGYPDNGSRY